MLLVFKRQKRTPKDSGDKKATPDQKDGNSGTVGTAGKARGTDTEEQTEAPKKEVAKSDKDQLLGKWLLISSECNEQNRMQPWLKDNALLVIEEADGKLVCKTIFKDKARLIETFGEELEKWMLRADMAGESPAKVIEGFGEDMEKWTEATLKLDARTKPKTLDATGVHHNGTYLGIYKIDGDTPTWCMSKALTPKVAETGKDRPTDFSTTPGDGRSVTVYKRRKEHAENDTAKDQAIKQAKTNKPDYDLGFAAPGAVSFKKNTGTVLNLNKNKGGYDGEGAKDDTAKTDLDRLQGIWSVVSIEQGGKSCKLGKTVFMVDGKRACWQGSDSEMQGGLYLEPTSKPKTFDLAMSTRTIQGIYSLEGDTLRLCYDPRGVEESKRPGGFLTEKGSPQVLLVLKRTHGPEVFPFRLPDGTRAFPTIIEKAGETPPPPQIAPQPKDSKPAPQGGYEGTARVGKIVVVGNTKTETSVILKMIPLSPGDVLDYQALWTAEKNLATFNPTITVIDGGKHYKDIQVMVEEK